MHPYYSLKERFLLDEYPYYDYGSGMNELVENPINWTRNRVLADVNEKFNRPINLVNANIYDFDTWENLIDIIVNTNNAELDIWFVHIFDSWPVFVVISATQENQILFDFNKIK